MALNYAVPLPHDKNDEYMHSFPSPIKAKNTWKVHTALASSVITLGHDTTTLEIGASGGGVVIRWIPASETASIAGLGTRAASVISSGLGVANFDHYIPVATYRQFVVPIDVIGNPQSVQGVNRASGLYQRVAWIAASNETNASIIATEY
jgi:hypothetical protein